jgi:hypothetical protein
VVVVHALLTPDAPRLQDNQSYRAGYDNIGPQALTAAGAGIQYPEACKLMINAYGSYPSWWEPAKVQQGCLDYLHNHYGD